MSTEQRDFVDYSQGGDTGEDNLDAIQPISDGEGATQDTFRRPSENLRGRTEVARDLVTNLLYYRDSSTLALEGATGHSVTWAGSLSSPASGVITQIGDFTIRPFLTPASSTKATLTTGAGVTELVFTVDATAYASDGMNALYLEYRDGGAGATLATTISAGPVKRIVVVFDPANTAHDTAAVKVSVDSAIGGDAVLNGKLNTTDNGTPGNAITALAETRIEGTADQEAHVLPSGLLTTFTTANPLDEGDTVAIWYRYVVEPAASDPSDPKGGTAGGRSESNPDRGNATIPQASLFVTSSNPDKIPGAVPVCKVLNNELVFIDGTRVLAGATATLGSTSSLVVDNSNFAGNTTLAQNGGIALVTTGQAAFDSIDDRLQTLRAYTYTVTDEVSSFGGDYTGAAALANAVTAVSATGGTLLLRRGTYSASLLTVPSNVTIVGEGKGLVTLSAGTSFIFSGTNSGMQDVTVSGNFSVTGQRNNFARIDTNNFSVSGNYNALLDITTTATGAGAPSAEITGDSNVIMRLSTTKECRVSGADNHCTSLTIGTSNTAVTATSLFEVSGTNNQFIQTSLGLKTSNFSSAATPLMSVAGSGHSFLNLSSEQTGSALTDDRIGLELVGCTEVTFVDAALTLDEGRVLALSLSGSQPVERVSFNNSKLTNVATNDAVVFVDAAENGNHRVSFFNTELNCAGGTGVLWSTPDSSGGTAVKLHFEACKFVYDDASFSLSKYSSFDDCTFQVEPALGTLNGALAGLAFEGNSNHFVTLNTTVFDLGDNPMAGGGNTGHAVALFSYVRGKGNSVINLNDTNMTSKKGLFGVHSRCDLDGFDTQASTLSGADPSLFELVQYNVTAPTFTSFRNMQDWNVGFDPSSSLVTYDTAATDILLDNCAYFGVGITGQLFEAVNSASISACGRITFRECRHGVLGLGITAQHIVPPGVSITYHNSSIHTAGVAYPLYIPGDVTEFLFSGSTAHQSTAAVGGAVGIMQGPLSGVTMTNPRLVGSYFFWNTTAGTAVMHDGNITNTRPAAAGNVFDAAAGTASYADYTGSVNVP